MNERRITTNGHNPAKKGDQLLHACGIISDLSFRNMVRLATAFDNTDASTMDTSERLLAAAEKILAE